MEIELTRQWWSNPSTHLSQLLQCLLNLRTCKRNRYLDNISLIPDQVCRGIRHVELKILTNNERVKSDLEEERMHNHMRCLQHKSNLIMLMSKWGHTSLLSIHTCVMIWIQCPSDIAIMSQIRIRLTDYENNISTSPRLISELKK